MHDTNEAARRLGLAPSTVRRQIRLGRLGATKLARDWFVSDEAIELYRRDRLRSKRNRAVEAFAE